jgi:hypothetical protein
MAQSATDAIQALVNVLHDPNIDLDSDDRTDLYVAVGLLGEYED